MKKKVILFLLILLLCGCSSKPFNLEHKYYTDDAIIIDSTSDEINELIDADESFVIFVHMPGCISCANFKVVLQEFIEKNHITFYSIPFNEIKDTIIGNKVKYTPSVVIFNKGSIVSYLDAASDKDIDYYESVDGFKEWLSKYINLEEE